MSGARATCPCLFHFEPIGQRSPRKIPQNRLPQQLVTLPSNALVNAGPRRSEIRSGWRRKTAGIVKPQDDGGLRTKQASHHPQERAPRDAWPGPWRMPHRGGRLLVAEFFGAHFHQKCRALGKFGFRRGASHGCDLSRGKPSCCRR
ncbi:MAG: hypothetical protein Ct9H300mP14_09310 [Gammaproteobacteria bacterium]|nr:MAG: hypothetical protein Ct9H300mP14_09310 [Gammaproteobacteria bacterium]